MSWFKGFELNHPDEGELLAAGRCDGIIVDCADVWFAVLTLVPPIYPFSEVRPWKSFDI